MTLLRVIRVTSSRPIGSWSWRSLLLAVSGSLACLSVGPASGAESGLTPGTPAIHAIRSQGQLPSARPEITDVAIQPDGVLRGRIVDSQGNTLVEESAGLTVRVFRGSQVVADTRSDPSGQFALANLNGGMYQVVVERRGVSSGYFCRIWSSSGAPPQASPELTLVLQPVVLRGQSALWMAWPPGFTVTALTAGAIAGPIIYNNVHKDNTVPLSP